MLFKGISPKMNVNALEKFEIAYSDITVQHVNYYTLLYISACMK